MLETTPPNYLTILYTMFDLVYREEVKTILWCGHYLLALPELSSSLSIYLSLSPTHTRLYDHKVKRIRRSRGGERERGKALWYR